jgi:hypothetical protein
MRFWRSLDRGEERGEQAPDPGRSAGATSPPRRLLSVRRRGVVVGAGLVSALHQGDGTVPQLDTRSGKLLANLEVGLSGPEVKAPMGEGRAWITLFEIPVSEIEPAANRVVRRGRSPGGDSIPVGHGRIWLSNLGHHDVWTVRPERALTVVPLIRAIEIIRAPGKGSSGILSACFPPAHAWPSERALRLRSFSALRGWMFAAVLPPAGKRVFSIKLLTWEGGVYS